jgi:hypothetical protein
MFIFSDSRQYSLPIEFCVAAKDSICLINYASRHEDVMRAWTYSFMYSNLGEGVKV